MKQCKWVGVALLAVLACGVAVAEGQWSSAALFGSPADAGGDCKTGGIAGATGGGFHGVYANNAGQARYRRYFVNGTLGETRTAYTGFMFNLNITESLNGEIHIVMEDWGAGPNDIRWVKSSDGGITFPTTQVLTSGGCGKHPFVTAFGMGTNPEVLMTYYRVGTGCDKSIRFRRYNGVSWGPESSIGSTSYSEYDCFGAARSPLDGSIYRLFAPSGTSLAFRRYDGSWGPQTQIYNDKWAVRQHMAINNSGQVMVLWDAEDRVKSILYTPGVGSGPVVDLGPCGYAGSMHVCAIPGTNDFYMVVARDRVYGRRWSGGSWQSEESVQVNLATAFTVSPRVAADADGNLFATWEYWGSGKPQQWFAAKMNPTPPGPKGFIGGTVRDSFGTALVGATVWVNPVGAALTGAGGAYTIQVPVGTHTAEGSKVNYVTQSVSNISVTQNNTTTVNFTLPAQLPAAINPLNIDQGNRQNRVYWTAPSSLSYSGAVIRYSLTGFPNSPTSGQLLADLAGAPGSAATFTQTGLTNGTPVYYSVFPYFQDVNRFYATGTSVMGTPAGPGDFDRDGDVDQSDFGYFQVCLSGAFISQPDPDCQRAKFDGDDDVDLDDLVLWQNCFSGPTIPSNPLCAN